TRLGRALVAERDRRRRALLLVMRGRLAVRGGRRHDQRGGGECCGDQVAGGGHGDSTSVVCVGSVIAADPTCRLARVPSVARLARRAPWLCAPPSRTVCPFGMAEPFAHIIGTSTWSNSPTWTTVRPLTG